MAQAPGVNQGIAGTAVKAQDMIQTHGGEVGDAADIECGHAFHRTSEHSLMKGRHQGRSLAASGDIAAAEIGHHVNAGEFGQQGRVVELQAVTGVVKQLRAVPHGLAVCADGLDAGAGSS